MLPGEKRPGKVITLLVSFLVSLLVCGKFLHPFVSFCINRSPIPIVLLYVAWLVFRLAHSHLADQRGIVHGLLLGFETFLLMEYALNTYKLRHFDQEAFTGSLYTSLGLFLVIERARKVFSSISRRLPLPLFTFGMAALLFFGSLSTLLLLRIPTERFHPDECTNLSKCYVQTVPSPSGQDT